jgi:hypothetical protein
LSGDLNASGAISSAPGTHKLAFHAHIEKTKAGLFTASNNANAVFTFNRHEGNFDS